MVIQKATTRRPGRPKSEEKAAAIREAASHLFMTDGIERTSMDSIAQAAGVSKQTVYSHFRCKDDLFRACIRSKMRDYGFQPSDVDPAVDPGFDLDAKLTQIGSQFLTLLGDPEVIRMFRLMIAEAISFPHISTSFHETGPLATIEFITGVLADHLDSGDKEMARQAACDFASLLESELLMGLLLGSRDRISEEEIEEQVGRTVRKIRRLYPLSDRAHA